MAENTAIEWTDVTDNIIVVRDGGWWCHKISPGCANCYAARLNQNGFYGGNHLPYGGEAPDLILREEILDRWQRQTKPRKHFVSSMTDVFGEWVPQPWIFRYLDAMRSAPRQVFQVLTKRGSVMRREVLAWLRARGLEAVPSHIWLGVSVEDQQRANERIPELLAIPASVRFLSVEPLLGPVNIEEIVYRNSVICPLTGAYSPHRPASVSGTVSWVIVGGESGPNARPMSAGWVRSLRDQCCAAGVAFFFKQWGEWGPADQVDCATPRGSAHIWADAGAPEASFLIGKKAAGRLLDGCEWSGFPAFCSFPP